LIDSIDSYRLKITNQLSLFFIIAYYRSERTKFKGGIRMKKKLLGILIITLCVVAILGCTASNASVATSHFDYDEAYQLLQGRWVDTEGISSKIWIFAWQSRDGSECNIVNGKGYTNSLGDSLIYFDYKGIQAKAYISYYYKEDVYRAKVLINDGGWVALKEYFVRLK
jgi:hypothetical protein